VNHRSIIAAFGACIIFAGCSATQQVAGINQPAQFTNAFGSDRSTTIGMASQKFTPNLLYISNSKTDSVWVFPYPRAHDIQVLKGFTDPSGLCSDSTYDVWISNTGASDLVEYAHGGDAPIRTLDDAGQLPVSCAVDPLSGDLAIANNTSTESGPGSITIYSKAKGKGRKIPGFAQTKYVAYDGKGNLFVDGVNDDGSFAIGEVAKNKHQIVMLRWNGPTVNIPGGLQFVFNRLAVCDVVGSVIYRASVKDGAATVIGTTDLIGYPSPNSEVVQFIVLTQTRRVLAADDAAGSIGVYKYPLGGDPVNEIDPGNAEPSGVAISGPRH
jgi:hypothetical protein